MQWGDLGEQMLLTFSSRFGNDSSRPAYAAGESGGGRAEKWGTGSVGRPRNLEVHHIDVIRACVPL